MSMPAITSLPWTHFKSAQKQPRQNDKIVWLIGGAKIFYGVLLLGAGIGAVNLIGKNVSAELWRLTERWNIDFHNHFVQLLFHQTAQIDGRKLFYITLLTFGYAGLFFVEGTGLILGKYWAKWLVIVDTASFIPGEIYYLVRQFNWFDAALLFVNVAVVAYLVWRIKTREHPAKNSSRRPRIVRD